MTGEHRNLGMHRKITRRDFVNGVLVGVTGAYALDGRSLDAEPQATDLDYPPSRTGLRGNHPGALDAFDAIRRGAYAQLPPVDVATSEEYDLVVVGAGISGLAAAYFFKKALGRSSRILLLDNHDDFGGHAKRNEFQHGGRTFIGYGGTQSISTPYPWSFVAKALVQELGIDVPSYPRYVQEVYDKRKLSRGMFFDREHFGEDRLIPGYGRLPWPEFFARAPLTPAACRDLTRLYGKNADYLAGVVPAEKAARLAKMSYEDYLLDIAKISKDALPFFFGTSFRNNKRVDTCPALEAARSGSPGFDGLDLPWEPPFQGERERYFFHFPDGNATIARLLVDRLIPEAIPGEPTMETIVTAPLDYARLDRDEAPVRLRLGSTVVRVENEGDPETARAVRVLYVKGGEVHIVRARACVLACYNALISALVPELPELQKEALDSAVKVPMMYTNAFIRNWTAWEKLEVSAINAPGMYHTSASLDTPVSIAGYTCSTAPNQPIVVHMVRNPNQRGLPRREQQRAAMRELLATTFERIELEVRRQLARMLGSGGFDPARDILAITANRWPYGYSYTYDTLSDPDFPPEKRPHVVGRARFGLITIANSDAGAAAFTNQAIDEAHRAVQELLVKKGLT